MSDRDKQFARTDALFDQRWMEFEEHLGDLQRIAMHGPRNALDEELSRRAILFFVAEIYRRRSKRGEQPSEFDSQ